MIDIARPRIFDADILACQLLDYIDITDEPLIQEFCLFNDVSRDTIYRLEKENKALSDAIKKALAKQETYLIRNGSTGKVNPVFAIFRLKQPQFGYTDKAQLDIKATPGITDRAELEATLRTLIDDMPIDQRQLLLNSADSSS